MFLDNLSSFVGEEDSFILIILIQKWWVGLWSVLGCGEAADSLEKNKSGEFGR